MRKPLFPSPLSLSLFSFFSLFFFPLLSPYFSLTLFIYLFFSLCCPCRGVKALEYIGFLTNLFIDSFLRSFVRSFFFLSFFLFDTPFSYLSISLSSSSIALHLSLLLSHSISLSLYLSIYLSHFAIVSQVLYILFLSTTSPLICFAFSFFLPHSWFTHISSIDILPYFRRISLPFYPTTLPLCLLVSISLSNSLPPVFMPSLPLLFCLIIASPTLNSHAIQPLSLSLSLSLSLCPCLSINLSFSNSFSLDFIVPLSFIQCYFITSSQSLSSNFSISLSFSLSLSLSLSIYLSIYLSFDLSNQLPIGFLIAENVFAPTHRIFLTPFDSFTLFSFSSVLFSSASSSFFLTVFTSFLSFFLYFFSFLLSLLLFFLSLRKNEGKKILSLLFFFTFYFFLFFPSFSLYFFFLYFLFSFVFSFLLSLLLFLPSLLLFLPSFFLSFFTSFLSLPFHSFSPN
ncbi:unnamed protein product [Acanthosepion pharaonis]|uniref:Uncharacterized protein n=1 Tax=Acanthosepion pharaonis TaxID=158019 RepID=A0A812DHA9_ACAPH|nr:unnamed protein product [Sepia pharaonis]